MLMKFNNFKSHLKGVTRAEIQDSDRILRNLTKSGFEEGAGSREQGAGSRELSKREQGAGSREQGELSVFQCPIPNPL